MYEDLWLAPLFRSTPYTKYKLSKSKRLPSCTSVETMWIACQRAARANGHEFSGYDITEAFREVQKIRGTTRNQWVLSGHPWPYVRGMIRNLVIMGFLDVAY